jgi:ATP-dependent DNA helicase DinG
MLFSADNWRHFFPYSEPRQIQVDAINFALDAFINQQKRFVILDLGVGCGKSAIGMTVGRYLTQHLQHTEAYKTGTYVLTTQKVLQEQYLHDFGHPKGNLTSIKSSTNFCCGFFKENTCAESMALLKNETKGSPFWNKCMFDCCYKKAKQAFLNSAESITNYSYFLAETMYGGKITPRELLVLDEAHNTEAECSKFIEITVSEKFSKQMLKLDWPEQLTDAAVIKWIRETYEPILRIKIIKAEETIKKLNLKDKLAEFKVLSSQIEMLDKHACKIRRFLELWSNENWVMNIIPPQNEKSMRKLEFKPVDVSPYSNEMLFKFGKHVLMMSATIVNQDIFCKLLGIDKSEVAFISIDSPFPIENRPIYYAPAGKMAQSSIEETLPKIAELVKVIMQQHKGQKGIIHTHSYKIANYIKNSVRSRRLLLHDATDRDKAVEKHIQSPKDTVLISPSLTEGIDLKDDLSRFQIICKMPYPYLGDKLVQKRMHKNKLWYPYQTAKTIIQSSGRSIRTKDDYAITYILDENWSKFFYEHSDMFPQSFKKALKR